MTDLRSSLIASIEQHDAEARYLRERNADLRRYGVHITRIGADGKHERIDLQKWLDLTSDPPEA